MLVSWVRTRSRLALARRNLAAFAWFPLIAGLFFHAAVAVSGLGLHAPAYYLVVFAHLHRRPDGELPRGIRYTGATLMARGSF